MVVEDVWDLDAVQYWMNELANKSESTKKKYLKFFELFCEWYGKDPDELVAQ